MLLKDFLVAQTAGAVAVSWVDNDPDTASTLRLPGVEVRHHTAVAPDTDALPVILVRRNRPDHVLGQLERRPGSSRLVVLTDLFLFEPAVEKLVAELAVRAVNSCMRSRSTTPRKSMCSVPSRSNVGRHRCRQPARRRPTSRRPAS
jgi:hypothetical protein